MKAKIHIRIYKDHPLWDTAASGQRIVNLSNKNDPEAVAHEAEKLFLNLLKELKENEKNKKAREEKKAEEEKEDNRSEREGCSEEEHTTVETKDPS
jgi:hypothetical protein